MKNIKLIALDLDGTLLDSNKNILPKTYQAIEKAASMGIEIVPCTGRFYDAMPAGVKDLPFVNYSINMNGAAVFDVKKHKSLYDAAMDPETSIEIIKYLETLPVAFDAYMDNWGFINRSFYYNIEKYMSVNAYIRNILDYRYIVEDLKSFIEKKNILVQKIQFFSLDEDIVKEGTEYINSHFKNCTVTSSSDDGEINDTFATKGNALKHLAAKLGIDIEDVMAFGDGGNDISMIKASGFGIAMKNHKSDLGKHADFITLSNDEDGIAYALEKFVF